MELYLPPAYAKITRGCDFYKTTETFKRRSAASKAVMTKYWSDKRHRRRVDKGAKPVDVFRMDGSFVATYPSSRKAAIALFPDMDYVSVECSIRACRRPSHPLKSYHGYMFRDHADGVTHIEPYSKKPRKSGYHYDRTPGTNATKAVAVTFPDGTVLHFDSVTECAKAIHGTQGGIWCAEKAGRKYKGLVITKDEKKCVRKTT